MKINKQPPVFEKSSLRDEGARDTTSTATYLYEEASLNLNRPSKSGH